MVEEYAGEAVRSTLLRPTSSHNARKTGKSAKIRMRAAAYSNDSESALAVRERATRFLRDMAATPASATKM